MRSPIALGAATTVLLLGLAPAHAAVPPEFSVQGVLRNGAGQLQTMMVPITVTLFDDEKAGNKLAGPYGPTPVQTSNGLFSTTIQDPGIVAALQSAPAVWMAVVAGPDIFPRVKVSPDIYALMCNTAENYAGVLPVAHGGTGSATQNFVDLTTDQNIQGKKNFNAPFGIGTQAPGASLEVDQSDGGNLLQMRNSSNGGSWIVRLQGDRTTVNNFHLDYTGNADLLTIRSTGNVGIGQANPTHLVHLAGGAYSDGAVWTNGSSRDYKEAIQPLDDPLAMLTKVNVYRYRYRPGHGDDGRERIGVIAEELPDPVASEDHKGAPTAELIALSLASNRALLAQLQVQQKQAAEQRREIEALRHELRTLARRVR